MRHHLDPVASLEAYELERDALPPLDGVLEFTASGSSLNRGFVSDDRRDRILRRDGWVQGSDVLRGNLAAANELAPVRQLNTAAHAGRSVLFQPYAATRASRRTGSPPRTSASTSRPGSRTDAG